MDFLELNAVNQYIHTKLYIYTIPTFLVIALIQLWLRSFGEYIRNGIDYKLTNFYNPFNIWLNCIFAHFVMTTIFYLFLLIYTWLDLEATNTFLYSCYIFLIVAHTSRIQQLFVDRGLMKANIKYIDRTTESVAIILFICFIVSLFK